MLFSLIKRNYTPKKSCCHVYIHNKFRKEVTSI